MGKSRLLAEGARIAGRLSFRVGSGAAEPVESVVELAPLMSALFDGVEPLLEREALQALPALPEHRYWLLQDIQALLERAALEQPLLVCLDDLQWADSGTAAARAGASGSLGDATDRMDDRVPAGSALNPADGRSRVSRAGRRREDRAGTAGQGGGRAGRSRRDAGASLMARSARAARACARQPVPGDGAVVRAARRAARARRLRSGGAGRRRGFRAVWPTACASDCGECPSPRVRRRSWPGRSGGGFRSATWRRCSISRRPRCCHPSRS